MFLRRAFCAAHRRSVTLTGKVFASPRAFSTIGERHISCSPVKRQEWIVHPVEISSMRRAGYTELDGIGSRSGSDRVLLLIAYTLAS